jgi:hypothetical protein
MKIDLRKIKVSELVEGYVDKQEEGVRGYGGRLNIRPAYQREFIYKEKQRNEVIHTVRKGFPLNTMYWVVAGDGYELMDGQQRTISICQYVQGDFALMIDGSPYFWDNLTAERKQQILDYELQVYICEGTDQEKLDCDLHRSLASRRQALVLQDRLPRLRNRREIRQRLTDPPRLPGDGVGVDQRRQGRGVHERAPARR